ncbi:MAG: transcription termination/antitermination NusG family protein [Plesiomonas sp.]|uniref:transcription termination/antitermination NusG family protein n=1 Tax=Plesiomonas sp. TaxID=2486279 RepID=UPI003F2F733E
MDAWYLLYCKRGQQSRAVQHLDMQAIRHFCPVLTVKKLRRGHWREEQEVLFPNYLFVYFDPDVFSVTKVHATRGVARMVRFGDELAKVPDDVMQGLECAYANFNPNRADLPAELSPVTPASTTSASLHSSAPQAEVLLPEHSADHKQACDHQVRVADTAHQEALWLQALSTINLEPDGEKRSLLLVNLLNAHYLQTRKPRR